MSLTTSPPYEYIAFIDESGDPGLTKVRPIDPDGASEWLILSAVVIRRDNEAAVEDWLQGMTEGFRGHQRYGIHFADLSRAKKLVACKYLAGLHARYFVVASNKKNMRGYENPWAEQISSRSWFYCWLTRLLLERVTHFVELDGKQRYGAPRLLRLIYSKRGHIEYDEMNAYYTWLNYKAAAGRTFLPLGNLRWSVMERRLFEVLSHDEHGGLHLADAVAGAFFNACNVLGPGVHNTAFAKALELRMGRCPDILDGQIAGYGLKLMPGFREADLTAEQKKIFRFYGYPNQWWDPEGLLRDDD